jgi:hypothetical protein
VAATASVPLATGIPQLPFPASLDKHFAVIIERKVEPRFQMGKSLDLRRDQPG